MRLERKKKDPVDDDDGNDGPQVVGEATTAMKDVVDVCTTRWDNMLTSEERIGMLDADQSRVFDMVVEHLTHLKLHERVQIVVVN